LNELRGQRNLRRAIGRIAGRQVSGIVPQLLGQRGQVGRQIEFAVGPQRRIVGINQLWIKRHARGRPDREGRRERLESGENMLQLHKESAAGRPARGLFAT
jgi:hypothetical protein